MDRNQSWFHGTTVGIIYHFKDPLNVSLQSDQSPELKKKKKHVRIFGFSRSAPPKTDVTKQEGVKWVKRK